MKTNRIKIISYENFPFGGAPANFLRYFSLALSTELNDIEVILPTGNMYGKKIEEKENRKGLINDVKYQHLCFTKHPNNLFGKIANIICGLILPLLFLVKSHFQSPYKTIIIYNTQITRIFHLIIFKFFFNKKLIIIFPEFYEKPKTGIISLYHWYDFSLGLKYFSKYADGFIPLSNFMKTFLTIELKITKPIVVIPNFMDPTIFMNRTNKPFIENKITIGYAGTPSKKDGVMDLIDSFKILNKKYLNTHLLIIGDNINSNNSLLPKLKKKVSELGIESNVTFTGLVPFEKIPDLYNSCQILALTRPNGVFAEAGFPTKLGEYFACKKPVLATNVGDITTYFKNKEHLMIVEAGNIQSIVNGFEELINDNELSTKVAINAYNWMDKRLNYKRLSSKLVKFVNEVSIRN